MTTPRTAAGQALDQDLDEWSGLSNAWTRNILAIEAEAAAPALTAEALAEALIECENDGLFGPNYVPIDAAKAILAHLEPRRTLGALSDD